nr:hypothetical protein [Nannocystis sp.]
MPHPGVVAQQDDRVHLEVHLARCGEELLVVGLLVVRLLELGLLEPLNRGHRRNDPPLHRRAEYRLEAGQHLIDRRGREAVGAGGLEPLHGHDIDLIEPEVAEEREEVRVEVLPIVGGGGISQAIGDDVLLHPALREPGERGDLRLLGPRRLFLLLGPPGPWSVGEEAEGLLAGPPLARGTRGHRRLPSPANLLALNQQGDIRLPGVRLIAIWTKQDLRDHGACSDARAHPSLPGNWTTRSRSCPRLGPASVTTLPMILPLPVCSTHLLNDRDQSTS